jgi:hypothetical protein
MTAFRNVVGEFRFIVDENKMLENFRVILQMFERVLKKFSGRSRNRQFHVHSGYDFAPSMTDM